MTTGSGGRELCPGPDGKYTVVRYTFPDGYVCEFSHGPTCTGTADEWAAAHVARQGQDGGTAKIDTYKSDVPVDRNNWAEIRGRRA